MAECLPLNHMSATSSYALASSLHRTYIDTYLTSRSTLSNCETKNTYSTTIADPNQLQRLRWLRIATPKNVEDDDDSDTETLQHEDQAPRPNIGPLQCVSVSCVLSRQQTCKITTTGTAKRCNTKMKVLGLMLAHSNSHRSMNEALIDAFLIEHPVLPDLAKRSELPSSW